jgi:osmotically-inducible protein OsmY
METDTSELIAKIKRMIRRETNLGVQEMRVSMEGGKVVLSGHCRTFYTKQLAQQAAMTVIGTDELVNEIRVA